MKGSFTPMPIPFLEALRGRLAPVFNGTVPLEREKEEKGHESGLAGGGEGGEGDRRHKHTTSATQTVHIYVLGVALKRRRFRLWKKKKKALMPRMVWGADCVGMGAIGEERGTLRVTTRQPGGSSGDADVRRRIETRLKNSEVSEQTRRDAKLRIGPSFPFGFKCQ